MTANPPRQPKPADEHDATQKAIERDMVKWTRAVAWFTGLLFAANIVTNFFIYQQWRVANDAQVDTREQLRAVVTLASIIILPIPDKDKKITHYGLIANFQNFGGTRTSKFVAWDSVRYFEGTVPNNVDFSKPPIPLNPSNTTIGPNSPYQLTPVTVTQAEVDAAGKKEGVIVLWGRAEYADIFDPKDVRPISFCVQLTPVAAIGGADQTLQVTPYRNDCNQAR